MKRLRDISIRRLLRLSLYWLFAFRADDS